ncbi:MAG: MFS transporter, partial [Myxococcota bacterium]|nr:MFS transporter [Myxococcota bacterium]
ATPSAPPRATRRGDLRAIVGDGVAFSVMVGLGETYVPAFVLALGLGASAAGLIATVPLLAGALLQTVTPFAVRHLGSYRRWVVACAVLQGLALLPLAGAALRGEASVLVLFAVVSAYWGFGMATGPAWNAWVGALVPPRLRARFFARRQRLAQAALLAAIAAAAVGLDLGRTAGAELGAFAVLFVLAALARMVSARFLWRQSEPPGLARSHRALGLRRVLAAVRRSDAGRLLRYLLAVQAAVHLAAPFFTPYMLGPLGLDYVRFMALTGMSFAARIAVLPALGVLAHRRGTGALLWLGAVGVTPLPALWLVSDAFGYLLVLQALSGSMWAALELGTALAFFESLEERDRASILTFYNLAHAAALTGGALLGAVLFGILPVGAGAYAVVFALSAGARLAVLPLLRGAPRAPVPPEGVALRTLAVRPSAGAVQRPILATLEPTPGEDGEGSPSQRA